VVFYFLRLRESQEEDSGPSIGQRGSAFEQEALTAIAKALRQSVFTIDIPGSQKFGYDFALNDGNGKILIEVEARPTKRSIERKIKHLSQTVERESATKGIVITQAPILA
jgi:hypothetical protein